MDALHRRWRALLGWGVLCVLLAVPVHAGGPAQEEAVPKKIPLLSGLSGSERSLLRQVFPSLPSDLWVTLKNGITVLVREMPEAPMVSAQVLIKTGSIYEGKNLTAGLTHYLEHVVSGGSTKERSETENTRILRRLGGATNAYTSYDRTVYYIDTSPENVGKALDLLLSYALDSTLAPKEVKREKKVIEREILMNQNEPGSRLWRLFSETAYRVHPIRYPILGYLERFRRVTRKDLLAYYHDRYVPSNLIVSVAGNVDAQQVLKAILKRVGNRPIKTPSPVCIPEEPLQVAPRRVVETSPLVRLARVLVGFPSVRITDPDLYALDALAMILGQGRVSRLNLALKERKKLVLSVDCQNMTPRYVRGMFLVSMTLPAGAVQEAMDTMWEEIHRIQKEGPTAEELERARKKILADRVYSRQSPAGVARSLASSVYDTGDAYFDDLYEQRLASVTASQVREAARAYLVADRVTVAELRPPGKEEKAVRERAAAHRTPAIQRVRLENGLRLLIQPDATLPMVAIRLYGEGGVRYDPPGRPGLCRFMATLLTRGADSLSAEEVSSRVEDLGAVLVSGSGRVTYFLQAQCLSEDLDRMLDLMGKVLTSPTFPEEEIEKLRKDTLLAIRQQDENWMVELDRLFRKSQFKKHPFRNDLLGTEESVSSFTREEIQRFYRTLVKPNHMVLSVFGDVDPAKVVSRVEKVLGGLHAGDLPRLPSFSEEFSIPENRVLKHRNEKSAAGILVAYEGLPLRDPRKPLLDVIDAMVSGVRYPGGWLFNALRGGTHSLVYVVHGFPVYYPHGGFYKVVAQAAPKDADTVKTVILDQMRRLAKGKFTLDDLETAKNLCITSEKISLDTLSARADRAALDELNGLGYRYAEKYPALVRLVTRQAVVTLSKHLFRHAVVVETLPGKKEKGTPR